MLNLYRFVRLQLSKNIGCASKRYVVQRRMDIRDYKNPMWYFKPST